MKRTDGTGKNAKVRKVFVNELSSRLGLKSTAKAQEIEAAYEKCVAYLDNAPPELKAWAKSRLDAVNEAYAVLSDPSADLDTLAAAWSANGDGTPDTAKQPAPDAPASTPTPTPDPATAATTGNRLPGPRALWAVGLVIVAAIVVYGVFKLGDSDDKPIKANASQATQGTDAPTPIDKAKVAALMEKISANPKDDASLQALGDLYFQSGDYKNAVEFERKAIAINPKNPTSRLALGAALYNLADSAGAEKAWIATTKLDPTLAEAHYDLGYLYLTREPPDMAKVKKEWGLFVKLDPKSEQAKTVATHLKSLDNPASATASTTGK